MRNDVRTLLALGLFACNGAETTTVPDATAPVAEEPTAELSNSISQSLSTSILRPVSGLSTLPAGCGVQNPSATLYLNTEVQPMVVADPGDPLHLVANFQQDRWSKFGGNAVVTYVSYDGGLDWHPARAQPKFTHCAGGTAANGGDYEVATDSWLAYGAHGTVFQVVFAINQVARYTTAIVVSRSTDGGETWSDPVSLIADTNPEFFDDRPTVTVDPKHPDQVYVAWDRIDDTSTSTDEHWVQPFYLARSFDNGATWERPRNVLDTAVNSGTVGHDIVVLADGTLVDAYDLATDTTNSAEVVRSTDGGATWGPPIAIAPLPATWTIANPDGAAGGIRNAAMPVLVVGRDGTTLHAVIASAASDGTQHVSFIQSADKGLTWSAPVVIDHTPAGASAFTPMIAISRDGRIGVTYYDTRRNTPDPSTLPADLWLVTCSARCTRPAAWTESHVAGSFDVLRAPATGLGLMLGDYTGLVGGPRDTFVSIFDRTNADANNPQDVVAAILH
jgi:hypothetical protein